MKRPVTLWQVVVLALVLLLTLGTYALLVAVWRQVEGGPGETGAARAASVVQVLEPVDGAVVQRAPEIAVRASLSEPGFGRAELAVDGVVVGSLVNPQPGAVPWLPVWPWEGGGEGLHRLEVRARRTDGRWEVSPPATVAIVPPGRLAFSSNRDGAPALYVMETDGRSVQRLTRGPGAVRQPAWGGEDTLACTAETGDGEAVICLVTGTGEGSQPAGTLFPGRDPAWSPDGTRLAFAAGVDGVSQVFVAAVADGTRPAGDPVQVTAEAEYAGQPAWSPDGTRLAYVARRQDNWDVWLAALDGGEPVRLTGDPAMDWAPAWAPDGTQLAFVSDRGGRHQVYTMRPDGSDVRPLTDLDQGAEAPAWSPGGSWLAIVAYTGQGRGADAREIYLLRADGRQTVRLTFNTFDDAEPAWSPGP